MIVSTPYIECYVKKSFLSGKPNYGKDETIFGVLQGIRFVRARAPLFLVSNIILFNFVLVSINNEGN
jgi:hypothetical protein